MSRAEIHSPLSRKESAPRTVREFRLDSTPFPFLLPFLDQAISDGKFDLARSACEYFYSKHEGSYSNELFQVGLLDISLPFQQWIQDPHYNLAQEQRTYSYETAVNLYNLAIEHLDLRQDRAAARGIVGETFFYAGATRLIASSPDIPLAIVPAPLWMDASTPGAKERDGVDFITYYQDMIIPTQIKASRVSQGRAYREEILVLYMRDFTSEQDWDLSLLQSVLLQEVETREPSTKAQSFQDKLFAKIDEHAMSKRDLLLSDENILFTNN